MVWGWEEQRGGGGGVERRGGRKNFDPDVKKIKNITHITLLKKKQNYLLTL